MCIRDSSNPELQQHMERGGDAALVSARELQGIKDSSLNQGASASTHGGQLMQESVLPWAEHGDWTQGDQDTLDTRLKVGILGDLERREGRLYHPGIDDIHMVAARAYVNPREDTPMKGISCGPVGPEWCRDTTRNACASTRNHTWNAACNQPARAAI